MKKGFTIVELMMVCGIIGILLTIVTTAASSSVKQARYRKAQSLCKLVQTGLATYYAQNEKWPIQFDGKSSNVDNEPYLYELSGGEVRECVKALVEETRKNNPVIDVSGLFVSRNQGEATSSSHGYGLDFMQAIHGTRKSSQKMKLADMYFGYPETDHGWFRRFRMRYSFAGDTITVYRWED